MATPGDEAAAAIAVPPPPPAPEAAAPVEAAAAPTEAPSEQAVEGPPGVDLSWLPPGKKPLADGVYDAIVMGTGLKECIISGLLSVMGLKVLHIDRNNYYGGDCASLNLTNLYAKFRNGAEPPAALGSNRDYNVDLVPKFIMACGDLVKILLHTKVTRYLEFKNVDGSYVFKAGRIYKVPATLDEALMTSLIGLFEKRRFRNFLSYLAKYDEKDPNTYGGYDLTRMTMRGLYDKYGLDEGTRTFTGHAMALQLNDGYLDRPAIETVRHIQLYCYSLERYGKSPYIYPIYGLGGLPEGFSRLCAINGGTFMLDHAVDEVLYDAEGVAYGIRHGDEMAKAKYVVGDPSYFPRDKVRPTGRVVRSIVLMDHPVADTKNSESAQIIIPASEVQRSHDIYVAVVSYAHAVAAQGMFIAIASTTVETSNPLPELEPAIRLLGPYIERFDSVEETFEPVADGSKDHCFISSSYDATSHFETTAADVLSLYKRITGKELDLTISADSTNPDDY